MQTNIFWPPIFLVRADKKITTKRCARNVAAVELFRDIFFFRHSNYCPYFPHRYRLGTGYICVCLTIFSETSRRVNRICCGPRGNSVRALNRHRRRRRAKFHFRWIKRARRVYDNEISRRFDETGEPACAAGAQGIIGHNDDANYLLIYSTPLCIESSRWSEFNFVQLVLKGVRVVFCRTRVSAPPPYAYTAAPYGYVSLSAVLLD